MKSNRSLPVVLSALALLGLAIPVVLSMQSDPGGDVLAQGFVDRFEDLPDGASVASDRFRGEALNDGWRSIDVDGDDSLTVSDGLLRLRSEREDNAELWSEVQRPRVAQEVDDEDLAVEVSFIDLPSEPGQSAGVTFEASDTDWIGYEMSFDNDLRLSAIATSGGESEVRLVAVLPPTLQGVILRVVRQGNVWSFAFAADGIDMTALGTFDADLAPSQIAVGASSVTIGEDPDAPPPVTEMTVLAFENAADPVGAELGDIDVDVEITGRGSYELFPPVSMLRQGDQLAIKAIPDDGSVVDSFSGNGNVDGEVFRVVVTGSVEAELAFSTQSNPEIELFYGNEQNFGQNGQAQNWVNILGNASDVDGLDSLTYSLNGGGDRAVTLGPDGRRLAEPGDFNLEIAISQLLPGENTVRIVATDPEGNTAVEDMVINMADEPSIDISESGEVQEIRWGEVSDLQDVVQILDGKWQIQGDRLVTVEPDYDRAIVVGNREWRNYEIEVPITPRVLDTNAYQENSGAPGLFLLPGWLGHVDWTGLQPNTGYWPSGALAFVRWPSESHIQLLGNQSSVEDVVPQDELEMGTTYILKLRTITSEDEVEYWFKVYPELEDEPAAWDVNIVETTGTDHGSVVIGAHHVDAAIGDITVRPL